MDMYLLMIGCQSFLLYKLPTSKCPLLLTKGIEQTTMMVRARMRMTPVTLAQPGIRPKRPGRVVNIHCQ